MIVSGLLIFLLDAINAVPAAVFSIPSQLFNFRVQHKYQGQITDLTLQKQLQDLQKQVLAGQTKGPGIRP